MYKHILVPVAPSHPANTQEAIKLAQLLKADDGKITLISAMSHIPASVAQYLPADQIERTWSEAKTALLEEVEGVSDVEVQIINEDGSAGSTIIEYANKHESDLIIIASHRPGLQDYFLGSTAARVVRHASCAVHIIR